MQFEGFKKDTDVIYKDLVDSYTSTDNEDNWFEVSEIQNSTQSALVAYKGCERVGIWIWDDTFPEKLEDFIKENIIKKVY